MDLSDKCFCQVKDSKHICVGLHNLIIGGFCMNKVVHFEIPVDDLERAQKFYKSVFGWKMESLPEMEYNIIGLWEKI